MATALGAPSGEAAPRRRARRALLTAVVAAALLSPSPGAAAAAPSDRAPNARPATTLPSGFLPAQVPATDPEFVDVPLPTNPISLSLLDVAAESAELESADDALEGTEDRRDGAIAEQDRLRRHLVDLADERVETVDLLAQRRADEEQRGIERLVAVEFHAQRVRDVEEAQGTVRRAQRAVAKAQDALRELLIANYMSESSNISDISAVLSGQSGVNDALVRLSLGESSIAARVADIEDRLADLRDTEAALDRAEAARDAAARERDRAQQAERDAVAAREGTEQHIRDIDAESERTVREEADAVAEVGRREVDVLVARAEVTPARLRADVVGDGLDFQLVALDAWLKAAASADCKVEWWMLAAISKIEGRHGTFGGGQLGARGYPTARIIGPALNGTNGNANIGDTDGGLYDDDSVLDHAVGPMQFIPSTWARWGRDGDGDGAADPHTFYDATAGAVAYLCAGRTDLTDEAQLRAAYFSYNHSLTYVAAVLSEARRYQAALQIGPHVPAEPAPGP
ncbi:MAG: hypothetical protein ACR2JF_13805 [Iamia sp.]